MKETYLIRCSTQALQQDIAFIIDVADDRSGLDVLYRSLARGRASVILTVFEPRHRANVLQAIFAAGLGSRPAMRLRWDESKGQLKSMFGRSYLAYIPHSGKHWRRMVKDADVLPKHDCIRPLLRASSWDGFGSVGFPIESGGWIAGPDADRIAIFDSAGSEGLDLVRLLCRDTPALNLNWESYPPVRTGVEVGRNDVILPSNLSILAVVSHYKCEQWLPQCLTSLVRQWRHPEAIAVIDDGSGSPPIDIIEGFEGVTLLSTTMNVGPERILHNIIRQTQYDAYLIQDADDWSATDRLELLCRAASQSSAEIVGSQEIRVFASEPDAAISARSVMLRTYPLDVSGALRLKVGHCILHGTSLIFRNLAQRIGGFDARFHLSSDSDFHYRAALHGRVINTPHFSYFRRSRPGSLTTHPETGLDSARRRSEIESIRARAQRNVAALRSGLTPATIAERPWPALEFVHVAGPRIEGVSSRPVD